VIVAEHHPEPAGRLAELGDVLEVEVHVEVGDPHQHDATVDLRPP
jgi:hypothetical protein